MKRTLLVLFVLGGVVACRLLADEPNASPAKAIAPEPRAAAQPSADETAIRQSVVAYVDAFNRHDAKGARWLLVARCRLLESHNR